jgi:hydrogenase maturation protein HypF
MSFVPAVLPSEPRARPTMALLVLGYGNTLRGDDGVGPFVARTLATLGRSEIDARESHQLTPEMSECLARAERVVFVDAAADRPPGTLDVRPLEPSEPGSAASHFCRPEFLLGLARLLHGRCPPAWLLTIGASTFDQLDRLSPEAEAAARKAVEWIVHLADSNSEPISARRFTVTGRVQGVGFRPFVSRLAARLGLRGWIANDGRGVCIHAEGAADALAQFAGELRRSAPASAQVADVRTCPVDVQGLAAFAIQASEPVHGPVRVRVPPDRAICAHCAAEVLDPANRRHAYPLITCTDCGPRYTILEHLPYDRPATTMRKFEVCGTCDREFHAVDSRRGHAQTLSCHDCGPQVVFHRGDESQSIGGPDALRLARAALTAGEVLALKGIGGFQLLVRADRSEAVTRLRQRKRRPSRPFALMPLSLAAAEQIACLTPADRAVLSSPENPIVLATRRSVPSTEWRIAPEVAPRLVQLGLMLPTTGLHQLLLNELPFPVVATSGNRSEEPITMDESGSERALGEIADAWLTHDRPIHRRVDDSVVRVLAGRATTLRLARGYAPWPLPALERFAERSPEMEKTPVLAVGGHQKASVALWSGVQAVLGPHVGDLDETATRAAFEETAAALTTLYQCQPAVIACDLHPDYFTTRWAEQRALPLVRVQHHHAHAAACLVEHDLLEREVLAFAWDGTGFGPDSTLWGGEAFVATVAEYRRAASLRPFPLPGGEAAVREPARIALGLIEPGRWNDRLLRRLGFEATSAARLGQMIARGVNCPQTSSVGRLFDAAAALILGANRVTYEGEAALWLESAADRSVEDAYPMPTDEAGGILRGDWRPMIDALLDDLASNVPAGICAARFHNMLAEWAAAVAGCFPGFDIVLTGGCFQNDLLLSRTRAALERLGRRVYCHQAIPPNDGGLAAGQLAVALAVLAADRGR